MNEDILHIYCDHNMKELRKICDMLMKHIGGISNKDYDDFYSIGLEALYDSVKRFDPQKSQFRTFLIGNIKRKFKTEIRDRNRAKRIPTKKLESTSNLVTEDGLELGETIPSEFNTYEVACEYLFEGTKIERYLNRLSHKQREIVALLSEGYKANDIKVLLHMSAKEYSNNLAAIQAYENVKILM